MRVLGGGQLAGRLAGVEVRGLVLVDGAYPIAVFDEAGRRKVRSQFRRLAWLMRFMSVLGLSARMSAARAAEVVIELDSVNGGLADDFAAPDCPAVFVVGTGAHRGATEHEMRLLRDAAEKAVASNPLVSVFATTPYNHLQILTGAPDALVSAIEQVCG